MKMSISLQSAVVRMVLFISLIPAGCADHPPLDGDWELVVLHTNDIHSQWLGRPNCEYQPAGTGDGTIGGAARMAKVIQEIREQNDFVLLLDAGDFSMRTMLAAAENNAGDLNMLAHLGYDAVTLGNHEFDRTVAGVVQMIQAAEQPAVPIVCSNIVFDPDNPADDALEALYGPESQVGTRIHPYLVREFNNGPRVGIIGLMGKNALDFFYGDPVTFVAEPEALAQLTQEMVDHLRQVEQVDVVLVIGHLGLRTEDDEYRGNTAGLAWRVDGIDLILSGHHHNAFEQVVDIACQVEGCDWQTPAMEAGFGGRYMSRNRISSGEAEFSVTGELIPIDDSISGRPETIERENRMIEDLEQSYLGQFPQVPEDGAFLTGEFCQEVSESDCEIERHSRTCNNMGNLVADAVRQASGARIAVVSNGHDVGAALERNQNQAFALADLFRAAPMGFGQDGLLGGPLVVVYLPWNLIKMALESTTNGDGLTDNDLSIQISGIRVEFDPAAQGFGSLTRMASYENLDETGPEILVFERDNQGTDHWIEDRYQLVPVGMTLDIALMLGAAGLTPLDDQGDLIPGHELVNHMVTDEQGRPARLWYALAARVSELGRPGLVQYCDDPGLNPLGPCHRRCLGLTTIP